MYSTVAESYFDKIYLLMLKILLLRNVLPSNFGGIKKHCIDLSSLFEDDEEISILPIQDLPQRRIPFIKKTVFKFSALYKYLKHTDCDIVHIHGFATLDIVQSFLVARWLNKKIVYSPHYHPFKYLEHPLFGKLYFYGCLRFLLRFASAIATITDNDTTFFRKYHKKVYKIPHQFEPLHNTKCKSVEKQKNMILFVGRNDSNKGISYLYKLPSKYEVHLVTKGSVERKDFIIHSNISNEELSALYSKASLVVIPSRYEAFSYVALEAFAHGTPVVMSDRVMIACYLKAYKGYSIFRYGNADDFLQAVESTIGMTVDVDGIIRLFDKYMIKKQYTEVYRKSLI